MQEKLKTLYLEYNILMANKHIQFFFKVIYYYILYTKRHF